MALPYLRSGALIELMPQWRPLPMPISVVYPHNRHLSPKVRVFVDWAAELFERCPLLSGQEDAEMHCLPTTRCSTQRGVPELTASAEAVV
jgi:LysR family transcriptional regulator for bpeEF and oprC